MKVKIIRTCFLILTCFVIMAFMPGSESSKKPIYLNTAYSFEERAADLVSRMTPEEKQSLLGNNMAAVPRLGVNAYNVWGEALHGVVGRYSSSGRTATSFPNSVALGSAWDPALMKRETSVISDEARGFNYAVIYTLTYWSPVVEPVRDPRWGRTGESFGEDPFLVSQIGSGFIQGLMGNDPLYLKAVPCGKHYFANNSEFNRHTGSSDMDDRDMREFYLLPYKSLIEKDKLPAIMTCYNAVNGIPMSANKYLVDTIARKTYGLNGYITGDCAAISDIFSGHHYAKSNPEAAAMGLKSGVDTDCGSVYQTSALEALKQGLITEADMDLALVNMFTVRMRIGEFDPKNKVPYAGIQPNVINAPGHSAFAVEVATKTPVLLKNNVVAKTNSKALPIKADAIKKIAIIGPQADRVELGPYSGTPEASLRVTPLAGIKNYIEQNKLKTEVVYSAGGNTSNRSDFFNVIGFTTVRKDGSVKEYDATKFDASAKGIVLTAGMGPVASVRGIKDGDWTSYNNIDITNVDSLKINLNVNSSEGGIVEARVGSATGNLFATVKIAGIQPGMRMGGGFGRSRMVSAKVNTIGITGNQTIALVYRAPEIASIDKETLSLAASSDVAILFVGTDDRTAGEESDRFSLLLPGNQYELIKSVAAVNSNTIVVMQTLGMVEVDQFKDNPNVAGIIWTGFNGQAQGTAMASILFGDVNPGGKLNATWYKSVNDLPEITDYNLRGGKNKNGRTYWYFNKDVSYEFGFGLSYTTFEYSNFSISKSSITPNDKINVSVDVKNTGSVDGDEIVQVYMRTPDSPASLERPIKRLKGFQRVTIAAGQTKRVSIDIDCSDLWFWDGEKDRITFDQGKYVFEIGASSKDIRGQVEATMSGTYKSVLKTVVAECGKVVLRPGNTVQTSVTAAMSDDSFYNIKDANVTYSSNNPSVASVDENGKVTAKGVGTASIIAYVTVDGKTVSDSYPLKVMPDLKPATIMVNGKKITGFSPDIHGYSYLLKESSTVPQVNATASGTDITADIAQAKSIPGTAIITLTDNITVEKSEYNVAFGTKSVNDEFNGGTLGKQWNWVRDNPAHWSLSKKAGSLVITSEKGDILASNNNAENILLQNANTDWTVESKLVFSKRPSGFSQNGGLLAYQDDDNYVKLVYRAGGGGRRGMGGFGGPGVQAGVMELMIEKDGYQSSAATLNLAEIIKENNTLILRFEKKGNLYSASCSPDGKNFKAVGTAEIMLKDIKAGMITCNGVQTTGGFGNFPGMPGMQQQASQPETPFEVAYDYFHIVNKGLK
ncbi:MAG: glycoside hydrolase family 3 C-terminal domain-containing protein [Bacteroidales bacterium]|nr:glycoside hydrolase family 3 C-terminal domain-containing protein [Bacteroidales bacterium]